MSTPRPPRSQQTEPVLSHLRELNEELFENPVFIEQAPPHPALPVSSIMEQGPRITEVTPETFQHVERSPVSSVRAAPPASLERRPPAFDLIADAQPITEQQVRENTRRELARHRRPRVLLSGLTILLVAVSSVFTWKHLRERAAIAQAIQALDAMKAGEWSQAGSLLASAQQAAGEPEVVRSIVHWEWAAGAHPERILQLLQPLVTAREAEDDDFLQLARAEHLLSRPLAAQAWIDRMSEPARRQTGVVELETRLLQIAGQQQAAEAQFRGHLESLPDDPVARFKLAVLDYSQQDGSLHDRGRLHLMEAVQKEGDHALNALQILTDDPRLTGAEIEILMEKAARLPQAVESRFRLLSRRLRLLPASEAQKLIEREIQAAAALDPRGRMACVNALAAGLPQADALAVCQAMLVRKEQPLRNELTHLQLEILARLGRWQDVQDMLSGPALILDRVPIALWEACAAAGLRSPSADAIRKPLQAAFDACGSDSDPANLIRCAETASRLGQHDLASAWHEKAARHPRLLPQAQIEQLHLAYASLLLQESTALEILLPLARRIAKHPAARERDQFDADYLLLLSKEPPEPVITRLGRLPETTDPFLRIRRQLLMSLVYLRKQQDAAFDREIRRMNLDDARTLPPGPRAVLIALLTAKGDTDAAAQITRTLPTQHLLAEEKQALKSGTAP